jgi:hypothetical protein
MSDFVSPSSSRSAILTKAFLTAASRLGLAESDLASLLGITVQDVKAMSIGSYELRASTPEWDVARVLVLLHELLASVLGSDENAEKAWMCSQNYDLGAPPREILLMPDGLERVRAYLDRVHNRA